MYDSAQVRESMIVPLRKIRGCRTIPAVLVIVWLPYIATRCIETQLPHSGCGILSATAHAPGHDHARSHDGMAPRQHEDSHARKHLPVRTCCDLTGKCDVKVAPSTPPLAPTLLAAALPVAVSPLVPQLPLLDGRSAPAVAHAPPAYIRNVTLLI